MSDKNYGDAFCELLSKFGYTHCFYLAGGNIMHLLNSASKKFVCVPFVHEVAAGIAAEYFNEANRESTNKAFALVTAGPGLTNIVTAMAGAYLESRELLVVGGQVKSSDLKTPSLRQQGIQEIDGISLVKSITTNTLQISKPLEMEKISNFLNQNSLERKGPKFIEFCLDIQAGPYLQLAQNKLSASSGEENSVELDSFFSRFSEHKRPVLLIGGGVSRKISQELADSIAKLNFPVMTTWNAADRIDSNSRNYCGRPNTWGQRYANVIIQQADLVIAVGTRLGLQQTGFNWQSFGANASIVHVDLDENELNRSNLKTHFKFKVDANVFLTKLLGTLPEFSSTEWLEFALNVKKRLPLSESANRKYDGYWNPYDLVLELSRHLQSGDSIVPSSSGGAETVSMQTLLQPASTTIITNKGLASMGYGLAGAIGVAIKTGNRVFHLEGDGGFAQNLQEIGTVIKNQLPIKTFILSNSGYASIRMTQKSYFGGNYMGCDEKTGLGLPDWQKLFDAYNLRCMVLDANDSFPDQALRWIEDDRPCAFIVPVHPEQTYFPKITSRVVGDGQMQSNPIHLMTPDLDPEVSAQVFKYLSL